MGDLAD